MKLVDSNMSIKDRTFLGATIAALTLATVLSLIVAIHGDGGFLLFPDWRR
jgi:hypothetical protein